MFCLSNSISLNVWSSVDYKTIRGYIKGAKYPDNDTKKKDQPFYQENT
jgi:hypothetical protein